jgi:type I restriction enzyme, S subunit
MSAVNRIASGYKQTEVGVIPEDWVAGNLGLFWGVTDCKHVTASFVPNGIPLASIKEVQSRFIDLANAKQTTEQYYSQLIEGGRKPLPGDLIISRNATVGETSQVAEWHPRFAMGQDVCLLRKKSSEHSTDYLQSVFQSPIIANQLGNLMVGSTFKRVNVEQIRNFVVPMPLPDEQRAIATALSDVDALLAAQDKLIAKKRDIKQAAMQLLLTGKQRLPGFSGEWEAKRLGEVATVLKGSGLSKSKVSQAGSSKCVLYGELFTTYSRIITKVCSSTDSNEGLPSVYGDVLLPGSTTTVGIDLAIASALLRDGVLLGGDINVVRAKGRSYSSEFLAYLLTEEKRNQIADMAQGITIIHLYGKSLLKLELCLPSLEEQTAIAAVLSDMDTDLAALEQQRDKTRALKQGMMQELLTGRIRLV